MMSMRHTAKHMVSATERAGRQAHGQPKRKSARHFRPSARHCLRTVKAMGLKHTFRRFWHGLRLGCGIKWNKRIGPPALSGPDWRVPTSTKSPATLMPLGSPRLVLCAAIGILAMGCEDENRQSADAARAQPSAPVSAPGKADTAKEVQLPRDARLHSGANAHRTKQIQSLKDTANQLRTLLNEDLRTGKAWALKENFRRMWEYRQTGSAMRFAHERADAVAATGIAPMMKAAETVMRHLWGIVSFVRHPITNAATEGINSMIQSLRHAARGLPNFASFRNRVLFHLGQLSLKPA